MLETHSTEPPRRGVLGPDGNLIMGQQTSGVYGWFDLRHESRLLPPRLEGAARSVRVSLT